MNPLGTNRLFNVKLIILLTSIFLISCSSQKKTGEVNTAAIPLNDLNLVKSKIPAILRSARENPYAIPSDPECASLNTIIDDLDSVLIPDFDATEAQKINYKKNRKAASQAINSAVKSLVPFRGWLRKLSGAERHSKQVAKAIAAGITRRAFLKGIRSTKQCPPAKQLSEESEVL